MKKTWLIFVNSLQRMRLVIGASLTVGILLCAVTALFSSIAVNYNAPVTIGYIDRDNSALSSDFERYCTERLNMEFVTGDEAYLNNELVEKHISAIVEFPAGLEAAVLDGKDGSLQLTFMDDYLNKLFLQSYFELYMDSVEMLAPVAQGDVSAFEDLLEDAKSETAAVTTAGVDELQGQREKLWSAFMVGTGFFLFISGIFVITLASIVFDDRANNTFKRVQATNVNAVSYVIGVCAAGFIAIAAMTLVYLLYCFVSGIGDLIDLRPVTLLFVLFVLLCVAFGLACGQILNSRNTILFAVLGVSIVTTILGGGFFPVSYAPEFMQQLAHITPQFWLTDMLYRMHDGATDAWVLSAGILTLFSVLFFLVAGVQFASKSRSA